MLHNRHFAGKHAAHLYNLTEALKLACEGLCYAADQSTADAPPVNNCQAMGLAALAVVISDEAHKFVEQGVEIEKVFDRAEARETEDRGGKSSP